MGCDVKVKFGFKTYKGAPVTDVVYLYANWGTPGIPLDPFGAIQLQGLGGGVDRIYETFFTNTAVPPMTLMLNLDMGLF